MKRTNEAIESKWVRLGIFFSAPAASSAPDLERVLADTARHVHGNARLFPLVVTWLAAHGGFVAVHRLKRIVLEELDERERAVLGLILDEALRHGARLDLNLAMSVCRPVSPPSPLFDAYAGLEGVAEEVASDASRRWGVWAPAVELRWDGVQPIQQILRKNPSFRERAIRKGDLRCSILETLRHDTGGVVPSEQALARLTCATRAGVRKALAALVQEGAVTVSREPGNQRNKVVRLSEAA